MTGDWKIDSIHLYLQPASKKKGDCDELRQYGMDEIGSELVDNIICYLDQQRVTRIELDNSCEMIGMSVFVEGGLSQISISDEAHDFIYYYDNGTGDHSTVGIAGYEFDKWMVCDQNNVLIEILKEFITTGKRLESSMWSWREESTW